MKKQSNKKIKPLIPNPSGNYFVNGGGTIIDNIKTYKAGGADASTAGMSALGQGLGVAQGAMQLGSQAINNFDMSGIGKEVQGVNSINRGDVLNTNVKVDSNQSSVAGNALSGTLAGAQAGLAFGAPGMAIGAAIGGLSGGISAAVGNDLKEHKAEQAEQMWTNNLQTKNRQFQQQDLRTNMANFAANGGDLFAYGGNIKSQLTEFNEGGTHEQNKNSGVMQGTGANGKPNLVEEGETKHEDYIFSDRLTVDENSVLANGLPGIIKGKTFANASKLLNKEAKERPNDPISTKAVKANLAKLTAAQETIKAIKDAKENPQQQMQQPDANMLVQGYANGGFVNQSHFTQTTPTGYQVYANGGNIFDGTQDGSNFMIMNDQYMYNMDVPGFNESLPANAFAYPGMIKVPVGHKDYNSGDPSRAYLLNSKKGKDIIKSYYPSELQQPVQKLPILLNALSPTGSVGAKYIKQQNDLGNKIVGQDAYINSNLKPNISTKDNNGVVSNNKSSDFSRYAPVAANMITGIGDMFAKPEQVNLPRYNPDMITSRMEYQPVDTEWMANKMKGNAAGTRDALLNTSGGNRVIAMAGLMGADKQYNEGLGEQYLKAQDINYGRKQQAFGFNAGVEQQNVASRNQAAQYNNQIAMQEMDMNARNRAAKRNAARQAILQASQDLGGIGRENYFNKTAGEVTGYYMNPVTGKMEYLQKDNK